MIDEHNLIEYVLQLLNQIKVLHWGSMSFAKHKALDKLYESLSTKTDLLVEGFLGKYKKSPLQAMEFNIRILTDPMKIEKFLEIQRDHMTGLVRNMRKDPEFVNIVEEMIAEVNKTIYLCRLS